MPPCLLQGPNAGHVIRSHDIPGKESERNLDPLGEYLTSQIRAATYFDGHMVLWVGGAAATWQHGTYSATKR